jgi:hypothetical protein
VCDDMQFMNLLTTCIHNSELQFTDHWHTEISVLNLLVSTSRLLATASTDGDSSSFVLTSLLSCDNPTTAIVAPIVLKITPWYGPRRKHSSSIYV